MAEEQESYRYFIFADFFHSFDRNDCKWYLMCTLRIMKRTVKRTGQLMILEI